MKRTKVALAIVAAVIGAIYGMALAGTARLDVKGKEYQKQSCFDLKPGDSFSYTAVTSSTTTKDTIKPSTNPITVCLMTFQ